jgi:hypothetical protein
MNWPTTKVVQSVMATTFPPKRESWEFQRSTLMSVCRGIEIRRHTSQPDRIKTDSLVNEQGASPEPSAARCESQWGAAQKSQKLSSNPRADVLNSLAR